MSFLFEFLTTLCFAPALVPIASTKKHFAFFVGASQLFSALLYNFCDSLNVKELFIGRQNWHFISDVLTLTYGLLLLVHLCMDDSEDVNIFLRYLAFFFAWVFKYRDSWDSGRYEAGLVVVYLLILLYSHISHPERKHQLKKKRLYNGCGALAVAAIAFFVSQTTYADSYKFTLGCAHAFSGLAAFELWSSIPNQNMKKIVNGNNNSHPASSFV